MKNHIEPLEPRSLFSGDVTTPTPQPTEPNPQPAVVYKNGHLGLGYYNYNGVELVGFIRASQVIRIVGIAAVAALSLFMFLGSAPLPTTQPTETQMELIRIGIRGVLDAL